MRETNIQAIDLNLLTTLEALLREGSVSAAARAVGLSQPAMSRALGRLRDLLGDPLLVRAGHRMIPTPRARALEAPLARTMEAIRRTFEPPGEFRPHEASRSFVVTSIDTTQAVVLPMLLARLATQAPGVEVSTAPFRSTGETFGQLASGQRDLAIGSFDSVPDGIRKALLYEDRMVCLVRSDHPRIGSRLGMKRYLAESHLAAESGPSAERPFTIEQLLGRRGHERRVVCRVDHLGMAPFIVARTDLICSAPSRTIMPFARGLGVRALEPPFETPPFSLHLAWHARSEADPGNTWLRETILSLFADDRRSLPGGQVGPRPGRRRSRSQSGSA